VLWKNYVATECPDEAVQTMRLNGQNLQCTEKLIFSREAYLQPDYCQKQSMGSNPIGVTELLMHREQKHVLVTIGKTSSLNKIKEGQAGITTT
jgi:hypothetical protein